MPHSSSGLISNASLTLSQLNSLNLTKTSSFSSSVEHEKITFSAIHSSFSSNSNSLSQYFQRYFSLLINSQFSSSNFLRLFQVSSWLIMALIDPMTSLISSSMRQKSSYQGRKVIWWVLQHFPMEFYRRFFSLARIPTFGGRLVTMIEQSESEQVLSSQQLRVLVMRSLMQSSTPRCTTKEKIRTNTSALSNQSLILEKQTMKLVQCFSPLHMTLFQSIAQNSSRALQLHIITNSRMMQYLRNTQKRGNPKPKNYSSLEFSQRGAFSLSMVLRQQGQNSLGSLELEGLTIPGKVETPCSRARYQSGSSLDIYIQFYRNF